LPAFAVNCCQSLITGGPRVTAMSEAVIAPTTMQPAKRRRWRNAAMP